MQKRPIILRSLVAVATPYQGTLEWSNRCTRSIYRAIQVLSQSCRPFSTKEPLIIGLFCRKCPKKIRNSMDLRTPVSYYRVAKTHKMPYLYRSFAQKSPITIGSFAKNYLQLITSYVSSPPCSFWAYYLHDMRLSPDVCPLSRATQ